MNLAAKLRPKNLSEFFGQTHLVGPGKIVSQMIKSGNLFSIILWGPPGSGKTTLAKIIANGANADFFEVSAVNTGKAQLITSLSCRKN